MALAPDAEHLLRELAPRVLGAVVRRCGDFATAEDAVQEALLAAVAEWPGRGVPQNPGGWLFHAACRSLADLRRSETARKHRESMVAVSEEPNESEDDTLLLLFTCCHPTLTPSSAIALTLRAVGGLTTAEIARAYLVPEATMAQRISRAKRTIADSGVPFAMPDAREETQRLASVLHVLYLIFNEGHTSSAGSQLLRVELSTEAIRLARAVHRLRSDSSEVAGLLALMLLTDARRHARTGPLGELIPLEEQERARWDRAAIEEGTALITATIARGAIGSYQIQAAIAALHDEAPSTEETDWPQILALYGLLRRMSDNPMVEISRAIAAAMVHGPETGLRMVESLAGDPRLAGNHRLDAVRGHLHERAGRPAEAIAFYRAAARGTSSTPERNYLLTKAARLRAN